VWTFDFYEDYVLDVAFSPQNPALFASGDGAGHVDLWNVAEDLEKPLFHCKTDKYALNKVRFSNDGSKLFTGNSEGEIKVFRLDKKEAKAREDLGSPLEQLLKTH